MIMHVQKAKREGRKFKQFFLLVLLNASMPTPALGFISGALASAAALVLFRDVLARVPLIGALVIGFLIVALALLWQIIFDHYWGEK